MESPRSHSLSLDRLLGWLEKGLWESRSPKNYLDIPTYDVGLYGSAIPDTKEHKAIQTN